MAHSPMLHSVLCCLCIQSARRLSATFRAQQRVQQGSQSPSLFRVPPRSSRRESTLTLAQMPPWVYKQDYSAGKLHPSLFRSSSRSSSGGCTPIPYFQLPRSMIGDAAGKLHPTLCRSPYRSNGRDVHPSPVFPPHEVIEQGYCREATPRSLVRA